MFYSEKIKHLENCQISFDNILATEIENVTKLQKKIKELEEKLKETTKIALENDKKIEAIIECLNGDRKDINILIQLVKKSQSTTKRKK